MADKPWHRMTKQEWTAASQTAVTQEKAAHPQPVSKGDMNMKTNTATKPAPAAPKPSTKPVTPPPAPPASTATARSMRLSRRDKTPAPAKPAAKAVTKMAAHKLAELRDTDPAPGVPVTSRPKPKPSEVATEHHPGKVTVTRTCALKTCDKTFTPDVPSRMFHSEECAVESMRANGKLPAAPPKKVAEPQARKRKAVSRKTVKPAKSSKTTHTAAGLDKTYGPIQLVAKILHKAGGKVSFRALLKCGHEQTVPSEGCTQFRCGKCKSGAPVTAKATKRVKAAKKSAPKRKAA